MKVPRTESLRKHWHGMPTIQKAMTRLRMIGVSAATSLVMCPCSCMEHNVMLGFTPIRWDNVNRLLRVVHPCRERIE